MHLQQRTFRALGDVAVLLVTFTLILDLILPLPVEARSIGDGGAIPRTSAGDVETATTHPLAVPVMATTKSNGSSEVLLQKPDVQFVVRARQGTTGVRAQPASDTPVLSGLYYDTYLPVYAEIVDASGLLWYQVRLWGVVNGWIRADDTDSGDPPPPPPVPSQPAEGGGTAATPSQASPAFKLTAQGVTNDQYVLRDSPSTDGNVIAVLPPGATVSVQSWQTDASGSAWYGVLYNGSGAWIWAGGVDLTFPAPDQVNSGAKPIWTSVAGKGMWLPRPLLAMSDPAAIVEAARALGLTHIYLEAGSSGGGFYGRDGVDRLLPVAHRAGIKVIGWLLTSLDQLPDDVSLGTTTAQYKTPSGDKLDGIAPDVEFNTNADDVRAFSQILRSQLGPNELIVGVIYPAGTWIAREHPVAGILARSFNVLAPMDYWHDAQRGFTGEEISQFVEGSVSDIHNAVGDSSFPVEVIGQTYDAFSRNGSGPNNPTEAEVSSALNAARSSGATGVSLFQWGTTTPAEWNALRSLSWNSDRKG